MFAVVEFNNNKKEYSIIPLIWLSDDKQSCMWPKNIKSETQLQTMVEELSQPSSSWNKYSIKRIHDTKDTYSAANLAMQLIIAESSSSATDPERDLINLGENQEVVQDAVGDLENCNNLNKRKRKLLQRSTEEPTYLSDSDDLSSNHSRRKSSEVHFSEIDFNSSSSNDDQINKRELIAPKKISATPSSSLSKYSETQIRNKATLHLHRTIKNSPLSSRNSSPSESLNSFCANQDTHSYADRGEYSGTQNRLHSIYNTQQLDQWQQIVVQDLERIKTVQEQQSTLLSQIWQALQVKNVQALQRPADVPEFPIERSSVFAGFEKWLKHEKNYVYMRARIASLGGTTVRSAVMNMMKFILSNRLGMAFNWAGSIPKSPNQRRKYAFKKTETYKVINEATKICFQGKENIKIICGDATDKEIGQACQDWLKQSKHRFQNSVTK